MVRDPKQMIGLVRYDFLDGLRAILAIYVVLGHAFRTVNDYDSHLSSLFRIFSFAHWSVCFFIILSGFCLTLPTLKHGFTLNKGIVDFFIRRARRILSSYYCALLFSLALIVMLINEKTGTQWDVSLPVTFHNVVSHVLLIQNFFDDDSHKINYVFWSISVEWQIYFFLPLLLLSWRRAGPAVTTGITVLLSLLLEKGFRSELHISPFAHFLGLFAMGMLAAYISFSSSDLTARYRAMPWWLIAVVMWVASFAFNRFDRLLLSDLSFGCCGAAILIHTSFHPQGWLHKCLDFKPLVFVGGFSYSLYLIHAPLLQILWQYPLARLHLSSNALCLALMLVGMPLILLTSYLFYLLFERPFLQKKVIHVP